MFFAFSRVPPGGNGSPNVVDFSGTGNGVSSRGHAPRGIFSFTPVPAGEACRVAGVTRRAIPVAAGVKTGSPLSPGVNAGETVGSSLAPGVNAGETVGFSLSPGVNAGVTAGFSRESSVNAGEISCWPLPVCCTL
ncbi:MAG: hypothetical protein LBF09_07660, partial [Odoribacteraceae bacterium]|nr:hypothetical protein [Odoribacteraceae bacterium]